MMPKVIGITGHMQAGKDTVASYLAERFAYEIARFSGPLKQALYDINPYVVYMHHPERLQVVIDTHGWELAKTLPEIRRLLQELGTRMRGVDDMIWINAFEGKVFKGWSYPIRGNWVVPDVRFLNEGAYIQAKSAGELWRVVRPGYNGDEHASETEMELISTRVILVNDGTKADLYRQVDRQFGFEEAK